MKQYTYQSIATTMAYAFDSVMTSNCTNITMYQLSYYMDNPIYFGVGLYLSISDISNLYIDGNLSVNTSMTRNQGE
jgi:hypothetical protein